ncbi:MAG: hypothetical protein NTZ32_19310 [Planctomycetales bacterium]|nr:hypothetical protein [Planctomycetales bacterium]
MSKQQLSLARSMGSNLLGEAVLRIPQLMVDLILAQTLQVFEFGVLIGLRTLLQLVSFLGDVPLVALDVRYAQYVGAGDLERSRLLAGSAFVATMVLSIASVIVIAAGLSTAEIRSALSPGASVSQCMALLGLVVLQGAYSFLVTHMRNRLKFNLTNITLLTTNAIYVGLILYLVPEWRVHGALFAFGLCQLSCIAVWSFQTDFAFGNCRRQLSDLFELCQMGIGFAAVGMMMTWLRLMSRPAIAYECGVESLGVFGVASVFAGAALFAGGSTARVIVQLAARAEGAMTSRAEQAIRFGFVPGVWVTGISCIACSIVAGGGEFLLPYLSNQHAAIEPLLLPVCIAGVLHSLVGFLSSTLRAQCRQRELFTITACVLLIYSVLLATGCLLDMPLWCFPCLESIAVVAFVALLVRQLEAPVEERWRFIRITGLMLFLTISANQIGVISGEYFCLSKWLHGVVSIGCGLIAVLLWLPAAVGATGRWTSLQVGARGVLLTKQETPHER